MFLGIAQERFEFSINTKQAVPPLSLDGGRAMNAWSTRHQQDTFGESSRSREPRSLVERPRRVTRRPGTGAVDLVDAQRSIASSFVFVILRTSD